MTGVWRRWELRQRANARRSEDRGEADGRLDPRYAAALAVVLAVALALRLWGDTSGLPWAYNVDEAQHFVPIAIGDAPRQPRSGGYFANPPAYTYLLAGIFKLAFGSRALHIYRSADSTQIWVAARVASAVLGTLAVWLLYLTGARFFDRRTGLIAAAVMAVAFLPVFYGKLALNDSPVLAPVCLSLWGSAGIARFGRKRDFAIAGLGLGLAGATKYTGGIVVLPLLAAALSCAAEPRRRRFVALWLPLAGLIALAAFIAANPYAVVDFHRFVNQLAQQSSESGEGNGKLGLTHGSGVFYYLWSLSWGVGWLPAGAAALGGAPAAGAPLVVGPSRRSCRRCSRYLAFMGFQGRYFGRWVMPIVPLICLLAAFALVSVADVRRARPRAGGAGAARRWRHRAVRSGRLSTASTRGSSTRARTPAAIARSWLLAHVPAGTRLVIEPIVPKAARPPDDWTAPWSAFTDLVTHRGRHGILYVLAGRQVRLEDYERTLSPALVRLYQRDGYCWVVTGSTEEGRAIVDPRTVPKAVAYYRTLAKSAKRVLTVSPLEGGRTGLAFNFDWSFDYYPADYARPGPLVTVYHLRGGACTKHRPARRHNRRRKH